MTEHQNSTEEKSEEKEEKSEVNIEDEILGEK